MKTLFGTDEAGRGAIVGNLVIAGVTISQDKENHLQKIGAKDSKLLTPLQREQLFEIIKQAVDKYLILEIPPSEIDDAVHGKNGLNLNWLEAEKTIELLNTLNPDKAIIDCPSNNVVAYKEYLFNRLQNQKIDLVVEHKADLNHPVVAASSILAKVTRDRSIQEHEKKLGIQIGSGYPSDPRTQKFLKEQWKNHPEVFRKSWSSYAKVKKNEDQKNLLP